MDAESPLSFPAFAVADVGLPAGTGVIPSSLSGHTGYVTAVQAPRNGAYTTPARHGCRHDLVESVELAEREKRHGLHNHWVRAVVGVVLAVVIAAEIAWLVPHVSDAADALAHPIWGWIGVALLAEWVSMVMFARLQRSMIQVGGVRVRLLRAIATSFAANAMSVTLPAGKIVSTAYLFRRMRSWGAGASLVTFGLVVTAALSAMALSVIALIGGTLAGHSPNPVLLVIEVLFVAAVGLTMRRLVSRPDLLLSLGSRTLHRINRLRHRDTEQGVSELRALLSELSTIRPSSGVWARGMAFAIVNWVTDLLCLFAACKAVGADGLSISVVVIAYAAGMTASSLPLLPGGLGVVDGALIVAFHQGGMSVALASAGVVLYRLISFVLVAAIGWVAWYFIRRHDGVDSMTVSVVSIDAQVDGQTDTGHGYGDPQHLGGRVAHDDRTGTPADEQPDSERNRSRPIDRAEDHEYDGGDEVGQPEDEILDRVAAGQRLVGSSE
jgi:uncharacterized protein (TIRG00374 family)